jgi:preprotein translocase subunit YajC
MSIILLFFQDAGGGSLIWTLLPFVFIFGIFYFLVILPQKRQRQQLQDMITQLKMNDEIVTNGGVIGKIKEVRDTSFIILSADKSLIEIGKSAVVGRKAEESK